MMDDAVERVHLVPPYSRRVQPTRHPRRIDRCAITVFEFVDECTDLAVGDREARVGVDRIDGERDADELPFGVDEGAARVARCERRRDDEHITVARAGAVDVGAGRGDALADRGPVRAERAAARVAVHRAEVARIGGSHLQLARSRPSTWSIARSRTGSNATTTAS